MNNVEFSGEYLAPEVEVARMCIDQMILTTSLGETERQFTDDWDE